MSQNHRPGSRPQITTKDVAPTTTNSIDIGSSQTKEDIELAIATETSMQDPVTARYAKDLAFMEDEVRFMLLPTSDKTAPDPIIVGVNGTNKIVKRGVEYKMARKFLNAMISTFTDVTTHEYIDEKGLSQTRVQRVTTPSLQIQMMHDPAGADGFDWFAQAQHGSY